MTTKAWHSLAAAICTAAITTSTLAADNLFSTALTGPAPTINGQKGAGEWTGAPNLSLRTSTYPIDTDVYFRHDSKFLYVLVDAIGDTHDNNWDECLLVFDLPPNHKIAEMWKDHTGTTQANTGTVATEYALGMSNGHRVYEFKISFVNLGLAPGQALPFYSPKIMKGPGWYDASMPFDAQDRRDNEYPSDLEVETTDRGSPPTITGVTGYSTLRLSSSEASVPTLSEWGLTLLGMLLAGAGAILAGRRCGHT